MNLPIDKYQKSFVFFVCLIVFGTVYINTSYLSLEISSKNDKKIAMQNMQKKVLGAKAPAFPEYLKGKALVMFDKDPEIEWKDEISINIPFVNFKMTFREEGFKSKKFSNLNDLMAEQNLAKTTTLFAGKKTVVSFQYEDEESLEAKIDQLSQQEGVLSADYDYIFHLNMIPNDPDFRHGTEKLQWNLENIKMMEAWDILNENSLPSNPIGVAIVDTGVAYENFTDTTPQFCLVDLGESSEPVYRYYHEQCIPPGAVYARSDDFTSDLFLPGYDFFDNVEVDSPGTHPNDDLGHGTHIAGTIAQTTNNANRFAGIGAFYGQSRIKIMPVKSFPRAIKINGVWETGGAAISDIIAGLERIWLYNSQNPAVKIRVVNLSFGADASPGLPITTDPAPSLHAPLTDLYEQGVVLVAAAGNGGTDLIGDSQLSYPARYAEVISVTASDFLNQRAPYANYEANALDITAPGGNTNKNDNSDPYPDGIFQTTLISDSVLSQTDFTRFTAPVGTCTLNQDECGLYEGTSMATPHVSAVCALILSVNPNLTPAEVKTILKSNANTAFAGYSPLTHGAGLVDAFAVLNFLKSQYVPTNTPTPTSSPIPTQTPVPTSTINPSQTPVPTNSPTASPIPTNTVVPTLTPIPTATPANRITLSGVTYCTDGDNNKVPWPNIPVKHIYVKDGHWQTTTVDTSDSQGAWSAVYERSFWEGTGANDDKSIRPEGGTEFPHASHTDIYCRTAYPPEECDNGIDCTNSNVEGIRFNESNQIFEAAGCVRPNSTTFNNSEINFNLGRCPVTPTTTVTLTPTPTSTLTPVPSPTPTLALCPEGAVCCSQYCCDEGNLGDTSNCMTGTICCLSDSCVDNESQCPEPEPTNTPTDTLPSDPTEAECGDDICEANETVKSCYDDCCQTYTTSDGDLNKDCIINSADWSIMWKYWTKL